DTPSYLYFTFNNLEATLRQKKVARTTFLNSKRPPFTKSPLTPTFTTDNKQEKADTNDTFYAGRANICFSNRERILLSGTIVVPTPFRPINFYVVPINTPFLLYLTNIDRIRIFFNNLTNII
ncbi:hypothetical protein CI238_10546, partial [Colletotrichum incanum]